MEWDKRLATDNTKQDEIKQGLQRLKLAYHDSCSGLRELKIKEQPRTLLELVGYKGDFNKLSAYDQNRCCGFGGSFCVTCPDVSVRMADDKIDAVDDLEAGSLVAGDLGCLIHLSGRINHQGRALKVYHVAELLADVVASRPPTPI